MTNTDNLYDKDAAKDILGKNYFVDKDLGFRVIERGAIVPYVLTPSTGGNYVWEFGGIVDSKGRFIKSSVGKFGKEDTYALTDEIPRVKATVIYLGMFYLIWGHLITEGTRYFWAFNSDVFRKYFKDCPLAYIPCKLLESPVAQKNFWRLMEILEIDANRLLPIDCPTQFENVILPDESFIFDNDGLNKFTDDYRATIDRVRNFALKNRTPTSSKKIYYFYGRAQFGEERLAEYFKSKGYEIISPERLTLDEQLNWLINADSFASTLGSSSHNSIFLRDGTEIISIPRAANRFTDYQPPIDQVHPLNVNYVDSSLSIFGTVNGSYCFIISEQLKKFFGDEFNGYEDDFKIFLSYVKFSMSRGFKVNNQAMQYYAPTYQKFIEQLKQRADLLKTYGVTLI